MIKNRTAQLIYQTVYCTLGLVVIFAGFGIFDDYRNIRWDFYVYFTNLSNYLCIGLMFCQLIQTIRKTGDSPVTFSPALKLTGMLAISLTFLVFNILLAGAPDRDPQLNLRIGSLLGHVILPVLFVADYFLFHEKRKILWWHPIASVLFPLCYITFIYIHAALWNFDTSILLVGSQTPLIYPYFFLNLEKLGIGGVLMWAAILLVGFMAFGYLFFGIDKLGKKQVSLTD